MNNCTGSLPDSAQSASPDAITIEILRSDSNPDGNLPSTFFPGAGSDGALFQVAVGCGSYPGYGEVCDALNRWDSDNMLIEYDENTGRGYFRIVDSVAPDLGEVITLPLPPVWADQDDSYWKGLHRQIRTPKRNSYVRASIMHVKNVETSDDPEHFHRGPEYDLYEVNVEHGPSGAFLTWFHQTNVYDWCRVGSTSSFLDLGGAKTPVDGQVIDLTFDEFFPQWLDTSASLAKAEIANMARKAISKMA